MVFSQGRLKEGLHWLLMRKYEVGDVAFMCEDYGGIGAIILSLMRVRELI